MAANFLRLFLLILAGISSVFSWHYVVEQNSKHRFGPLLKPDYRYRQPSYWNGGGYENYLRSLRENWLRRDRGIIGNSHKIIQFDNNLPTVSSNIFRNPISSDVYSQSNIRSTSSEAVNFAPDLIMARQKVSEFKDSAESSKDIIDSKITSNPKISETESTMPLEQHDSLSLLKKEDIDITDIESTFTTLENPGKSGSMELSIENKQSKSTAEFSTDDFTEVERSDTSFVGNRKDQIDGLTFPKDDLVASHTPTYETKEKCGCKYLSTKISSLKELFKKTNAGDVQTESTMLQNSSSDIRPEVTPLGGISSFSDSTESTNNQKFDVFTDEGTNERKSTILQALSSNVTRLVIPLGDKSSSSVNIGTTYSKYFKLELTPTQSSLTTDEDISLKMKSSSSGGIHSRNTQNAETESTTSEISSAETSDEAALQFKLSSSFQTKSTAAEISELESTTENLISSSKDVSVSFTDKIIEDVIKETFYTESPSSKIHFTSGSVKREHVIEISSIHTARIVVTSMFLVIALIALTVLAVFMFRLRRRTVHYDQLQLLS